MFGGRDLRNRRAVQQGGRADCGNGRDDLCAEYDQSFRGGHEPFRLRRWDYRSRVERRPVSRSI